MEEYNKLYITNEKQKQFLSLLIKQFSQKNTDTKKKSTFLVKNVHTSTINSY